MTANFDNFRVCDNIHENIKKVIVLCHVFDGNNVLFVTKDDLVFGLGTNREGNLGLGHNNIVDLPQAIPELCHKMIQYFVNGKDFVLAVDIQEHVYGWGHNERGQLARSGTPNGVYVTPRHLSYFDDKCIKQISCGSQHSLALTTDGQVYGWGDNSYGQVGRGASYSKIVDYQAKLLFNTNCCIKNIYCYNCCSFAITMDGRVYSWGYNGDFLLGHENSPCSLCVFTPQLVRLKLGKQIAELNNITAISSTKCTSYFLGDGDSGFSIYCCGKQQYTTFEKFDEAIPVQITHINKTDDVDLPQFTSFKCTDYIPFVQNKVIYRVMHPFTLYKFKTRYINLDKFYENEFNITSKKTRETNADTINDRLNFYDNTFVDRNEIIGSGSYGTVYKVTLKGNDKKVYAVKKIPNDKTFRELDAKTKLYLLKEVESMIKVRSKYVVEYNDSWLEVDYLYIQMEYCSYSLAKIIEVKNSVFLDIYELKNQVISRPLDEPMDCVEYFISCELFKEILESVQYLHELNPQIIHRDLNPGNILIHENGRNGRFVKLCDFGLATVHNDEVHSKTIYKHTVDVGNPKYVAPEVSGGASYDHKSDIYSLALIGGELFKMNAQYLDLDNLQLYSKSNHILNTPAFQLKITLYSMVDSKPDNRPECQHVLNQYNYSHNEYKNWSINKNILATDPEYTTTFEKLAQSSNLPIYNFFHNYLLTKMSV